jgi:hypothetical protein
MRVSLRPPLVSITTLVFGTPVCPFRHRVRLAISGRLCLGLLLRLTRSGPSDARERQDHRPRDPVTTVSKTIALSLRDPSAELSSTEEQGDQWSGGSPARLLSHKVTDVPTGGNPKQLF